MKKIAYWLLQYVWDFLPSLHEKRKTRKLSYFSFFTERWANALGEKVTGQPSMENLFIDG